jgi:hypothetical protein
MGYRSAWTLAVGGKNSTEDKQKQLLTWMEYFVRLSDVNGEVDSVGSIMSFILEQRSIQSDKLLVFGDDGTKCYNPWDDAIEKIGTKAESLGLDWAYVRIGEGTEDIEETSNCGSVGIPVIRDIGNPEIW